MISVRAQVMHQIFFKRLTVTMVSVKVRDLITHVPKTQLVQVLEETIAKLENGDRGLRYLLGWRQFKFR